MPVVVNNAEGTQLTAVKTENTAAAAPTAVPTIEDKTVPLVVFVGPSTSGKSMILVRLARYLFNNGYTISPDPTFLNTTEYEEGCRDFNANLNSAIALDGTTKFLLVDVKDNTGRLVAKLLEAPGEDFYTTDPEKIRNGKNNIIEPYLATIMASSNPKTYVTLLDLDSDISFRKDGYHRNSYAQRFLSDFYPNINSRGVRDKIILLYNKIDKTSFGTINGCTNPAGARKDAETLYAPLFARMKYKKIFMEFDDFVFKTFCTGMFSKVTIDDGSYYYTYNEADDVYPQELWKEVIHWK